MIRLILVTATGVALLTGVAFADIPPERECKREPWSRQGIPPAVAHKLARVMRQLAAAVPHPRTEGCQVSLDPIPPVEERSACWDAPETFYVNVTCDKPSEGKDRFRAAILVTLSMRPADYRADWDIVESTPDLLVTTAGDKGPWTTLTFGARRDPWIIEGNAMLRETGWSGSGRFEDGYRGPFIVSVEVAIRSRSAETTRALVQQVDRAAIMRLLKSEVEARRAARAHAKRR